MSGKIDLANRYTLRTKVSLIVSDELDEFCNQKKKDNSTAIRDFIEYCLQLWRNGDPTTSESSKLDYQLLKEYRDIEKTDTRRNMLSRVASVNETKFLKMCDGFGYDPDEITSDKGIDTASKRELCRFFIKGLLSDREMESSKIKSVGRSFGFSDDQVERSLPEVAQHVRRGNRHYWFL